MSCEKLGEAFFRMATKLPEGHPDRLELIHVPLEFTDVCRNTRITHTQKMLYGEKPPLELDEIPDFLLKVPRAKELFEEHNLLAEVLK